MIKILKIKIEKNEISIFLGVALILTIFTMTKFRYIGYIGILILFFLPLLHLRKIVFDKIFKIALCYIIFLFIRLLLQFLSNNYYENTFNSFIAQITFISLALLVKNSSISFKIWEKSFLFYSVFVVILGSLMHAFSSLKYSELFGSFFGNLFLVTFSLFLCKLKKRIYLLYIFLILYLSFFSGMRSTFITEILMLFLLLFFKLFKLKDKKIYYFTFLLIMVISYTIPYIYILLFKAKSQSIGILTEISYFLIKFFREKTNANFFSGRQILWPYIIEAIEKKKLIGYGLGFSPSDIYNMKLSTHNLFLFLNLESGLFGIILFNLLLFYYIKNYSNNNRIIGLVFINGILIQQTFSLGLLSGKSFFAIPCWIFLSVLCLKEFKD